MSDLPIESEFLVCIGSFGNLSSFVSQPVLQSLEGLLFHPLRCFTFPCFRPNNRLYVYSKHLLDRPVGDLGMHRSDKNGTLNIDISFPFVSLMGETSIVGRSVLILQRNNMEIKGDDSNSSSGSKNSSNSATKDVTKDKRKKKISSARSAPYEKGLLSACFSHCCV